MVEEVVFESERREDRTTVAETLRTVADRLEADGRVTLSAGGESVEIDVPEQPTFEVKVENEGSERSIEFELEWDTTGGENDAGGSLSVE